MAETEADVAALRHFQQVHASVLLSFLTRLTRGDVQRAEDIAQETLLRAWQHPDVRNADGHWNRPWLFTVAKRLLIDQRRSADVRPAELPITFIEAQPDPDDAVERMLDAREVQAALDSLPERWRSTLVELHFRDHSVAEAAHALEVPEGTIKSRTFHAVRALRAALVSRGFEFNPRPRGDTSDGGSKNLTSLNRRSL
ncbi:sigma-70 family RNA polymerase sigma factor [Actinoplanes sp. NBRC 103695]|uniref:sigma-70 family RNA polymerase sigma factor n=1 Tax=Actinoplanes sp. NBRC 103695 TaxID=3032202 RepID=UPI0025541795|nr:sigma-70 family RNA polymerase sigma factor [Actinoplanes sp. NBRC 103695]